jgi:hypothetical protein
MREEDVMFNKKLVDKNQWVIDADDAVMLLCC